MLHEIFKGMDNAAEMINENFMKTGVEIGKNENGTFIKHASGLALVWNDNIHLTYGANVTLQADWEFPIELVGEKPLLLATRESYSGAPEVRDSSLGASVVETNGSYFGRLVLNIDGTFKTSNTSRVSGFAVGFWKELE